MKWRDEFGLMSESKLPQQSSAGSSRILWHFLTASATLRAFKSYTGQTIEIRKFRAVDSFLCGCCGEALFDQR